MRRLLALLTTLFLLLVAASILLGPLGFQPWTSLGSLALKLRLLRTLLAILTCSILAVAGMLIQYSLSNPLATPDILGVLQGAYVGAVLTVIVYKGSPPLGLPVTVGFATGLLAYVLTILLASRIGFSRTGLILAGITVASLFSGLATLLTLLAAAYLDFAPLLLIGTFAYATLDSVVVASIGLAVGVLASLALVRGLDIVSYGDEIALSAGYKPSRIRAVATAVVALLSSIAVYVAGIVYFVALIAPNTARILAGGHPSRSLPVAIILGSVIGVGADVASRAIALTTGLGEVPSGVVTAVTGSVFLAYMLLKMRGGGYA